MSAKLYGTTFFHAAPSVGEVGSGGGGRSPIHSGTERFRQIDGKCGVGWIKYTDCESGAGGGERGCKDEAVGLSVICFRGMDTYSKCGKMMPELDAVSVDAERAGNIAEFLLLMLLQQAAVLQHNHCGP